MPGSLVVIYSYTTVAWRDRFRHRSNYPNTSGTGVRHHPVHNDVKSIPAVAWHNCLRHTTYRCPHEPLTDVLALAFTLSARRSTGSRFACIA